MSVLDALGVAGFIACAIGLALGLLVVTRGENRR